MTTGVSIDVVIVSHNTASDLDACLTSLLSTPPAGLGRIFVVDNASSDGSPDLVRSRFPAVTLLALETNIGFGAANNVALRQSTAPLVLLLNSDTVVPVGAVDRLVARQQATGSAVIGPSLVDPSGRPELSFGPMLSPFGELRQWWRMRAAGRDSPRARRRIARLLASERDVDWVSGACMLLIRQAALDAGLFDERYFMYEEDVDLCAAIRARGGRVMYTPATAIVHRRGASWRASGARPSPHYDRSHLRFYEKHRPAWAPLLRVWLRMRGRSIR
jgi:GT2 family glycosyltransferase